MSTVFPPRKSILSRNSIRILSNVGLIFFNPYISFTVLRITHLSKLSSSILSLRGFRDARISFSGSALMRDNVLVDTPVSMLALSLYCDKGIDNTPFLASSSHAFNTFQQFLWLENEWPSCLTSSALQSRIGSEKCP